MIQHLNSLEKSPDLWVCHNLLGLGPVKVPQGTATRILEKDDQRNIASFLLSPNRCATCLGKEIEKFLSDLFDELCFNLAYCMPDFMMVVISFKLKMTR